MIVSREELVAYQRMFTVMPETVLTFCVLFWGQMLAFPHLLRR